MFETTMVAGWGDMDLNGHVRNTASLDRAATVRMLYFAENGFPISEFARHGLGPVIRRDECEYFRELRLLDSCRVTLAAAGMSDDGSRFALRNEIWRVDGVLAVRVTSTGGWLDHATRRLIRPPEALLAVMRTLRRTDDFAILPSSVRDR